MLSKVYAGAVLNYEVTKLTVVNELCAIVIDNCRVWRFDFDYRCKGNEF